jgi:hypothetical protein
MTTPRIVPLHPTEAGDDVLGFVATAVRTGAVLDL